MARRTIARLQQRELAADGAPDTVHDDAYFGCHHRGGVQMHDAASVAVAPLGLVCIV